MIKESATKYDEEITKCTSFYASHRSFMEFARSQISAANYVATTSHALILDAQANIVRSEKDIPVTKKEAVDHNKNKWLKAVNRSGSQELTVNIPDRQCDITMLEATQARHGTQ